MQEAGLLDVWWKQFSIDSSYCLRKIDQETNSKRFGREDKKSLTMKGLSGAFLISGVGSSLAIAAFIVEFCQVYVKTLTSVNIIHSDGIPTVKSAGTSEIVAIAAANVEIVDIEDE